MPMLLDIDTIRHVGATICRATTMLRCFTLIYDTRRRFDDVFESSRTPSAPPAFATMSCRYSPMPRQLRCLPLTLPAPDVDRRFVAAPCQSATLRCYAIKMR